MPTTQQPSGCVLSILSRGWDEVGVIVFRETDKARHTPNEIPVSIRAAGDFSASQIMANLESTPLLVSHGQRRPSQAYDGDVESLRSQLSEIDAKHGLGLPGDRLPYNDYTTIDWLRDLVQDSARHRRIHAHANSDGRSRLRDRFVAWWDATQGWVAAFLIGVITAGVAFVVDVSVATLADWKEGYCAARPWVSQERCCTLFPGSDNVCRSWRTWASGGEGSAAAYAIYVVSALVFGILAGTVTLMTRASLPSVDAGAIEDNQRSGNAKPCHPGNIPYTETSIGKNMYMAAGSGIPEIKTILSGFVIPHFLDVKVLIVKAIGATFAVATGMCLGKEGPFVHISACVGHLVAGWFPKYRNSERRMREMLSVACSAGLSVAFGAPIGGVLFSYEVGQSQSGGFKLTKDRRSAPTFPGASCGGPFSAPSLQPRR